MWKMRRWGSTMKINKKIKLIAELLCIKKWWDICEWYSRERRMNEGWEEVCYVWGRKKERWAGRILQGRMTKNVLNDRPTK